MSTPDEQPETAKESGVATLKTKAWHVIFLAVLVSCTLALAWWQWTRFRSGTGTFQNLGYALQWPFFGFFFVYAYRKFLSYENEKRRFDAETTAEPHPQPQPTIDHIDENFLPAREHLSVEEFNARNTPRRRRNTSNTSKENPQ